MTDRITALTVVLAEPFRDDDAESLINAISQLRGVINVEAHVSHMTEHIAYTRVRMELGTALWNVLYPETKA